MPTERTYFQGVRAKLLFPSKEDKGAILDLMRRFSAARRYAYNRRVEGVPREKLWSVEGPEGGPRSLLPGRAGGAREGAARDSA